ncbi:MAG: exodeoxyribonuclease III, partial [Variovorax sp.]
MFKLTSLNLNGLRSASTKGVADWVAQLAPDCICMQEIRV